MSFPDTVTFDAVLMNLSTADGEAIASARARQARLTKPAGSLGRLEELAVFFAGWQRRERPAIDRGEVIVFAGNHGVTAHGVSAYPAEVTAQMVANYASRGAAINALAGVAGLDLRVVPLDLDRPTADFTQAPAMTEAECLSALTAGAEAVRPGLDVIVVGEMGIGNSTAAAALAARSLGGDACVWVGPGTGLQAEGVAQKARIVDLALDLHRSAPGDAFETLCRLGGRELVAIAGAVLKARQLGIPVVLDGFITCAAISPLAAANPALTDHCIAGHCSLEPGHGRLLERLGLKPLLQLDMRLGEASGGAVAVGIVRAALAAHSQMATFEEASVATRT